MKKKIISNKQKTNLLGREIYILRVDSIIGSNSDLSKKIRDLKVKYLHCQGEYIFFGGNSGILYNKKTGNHWILSKQQGPINNYAFSKNVLALNGGRENKIRLYDIKNWKYQGYFDDSLRVKDVMSLNAMDIMVTSNQASISLLEMKISFKENMIGSGDNYFIPISFFKDDNSKLASGNKHGVVKIWDLYASKENGEVFNYSSNKESILSITTSEKGLICAGTANGKVLFIDRMSKKGLAGNHKIDYKENDSMINLNKIYSDFPYYYISGKSLCRSFIQKLDFRMNNEELIGGIEFVDYLSNFIITKKSLLFLRNGKVSQIRMNGKKRWSWEQVLKESEKVRVIGNDVDKNKMIYINN